MNTFAYILLAFPFYLAMKGRLIPTYTALATTSAPQAASTGPSATSRVLSTITGLPTVDSIGAN